MPAIAGIKIVYGLYDHTIDSDTGRGLAATSQTDASAPSMKDLLDKERDWKSLTYLESDYWLLDGNQTCPDDEENYTGWESENVYAEGEGTDALTFTFAGNHDSYGIKLVFAENDIPTAFTITYYNGSATVGSRSVEENTAAEYSNTDNRNGWNKVVIQFTGTAAGRRARLLQVYFGIIDTYDGDTLIKVDATRTTDIGNDYEDCGTISFELFNSGRFAVSSIKDLPENLQSGQECYMYVISPEGDTDLFMSYTSQSTAIKDSGRDMTITAYDMLYYLNETDYVSGTVKTQSLEQWARDVADDAGLAEGTDYFIEDKAGTLATEVTGYIREVTHREALRLVCEAANAVMYVDRANKLHIRTYVSGNLSTVEYTDDDIVDGSYSQDNESDYKAVQVTAWTFKEKSTSSSAESLAAYQDEVMTGSLQKYDITYAKYPVDTSTVQIAVTNSACKVYGIDNEGNIVAGACLNSIYWTVPSTYAEHVVFYVEGTADDTANITITGKAYSQTSNDYTGGSSTTGVKKINKNYLITEANAQDVTDWQYARICNRYKTEAEVLPQLTASGAWPSRTDADTGETTCIESDILDVISFTDQGETMTCTQAEIVASADKAAYTLTGESNTGD